MVTPPILSKGEVSAICMKNKKALVTIAIGDKYLTNWKQFCEPGWARYATKYNFDLICLTKPLDTSPRASARSPAWQKCLILSQEFSAQYERIVWVDSDIIFNPLAPDVTSGVPLDKVGIVEDPGFSPIFLRRFYQRYPKSIINYTPQDYYRQYGLPDECSKACNTGLMVLSAVHRSILEHVYDYYEEKGGREWHMEQRPLSYELLKNEMIHWMDPRFNVCVPVEEFIHYHFLLPPEPAPITSNLRVRLIRKFHRIVDSSAIVRRLKAAAVNATSLRKMRTAALNTMFESSFFLHFGGRIEEMQQLDQQH